jgi:hypothetical protein
VVVVVDIPVPSDEEVEPVRIHLPDAVMLVRAVVYIQGVFPAEEEGVDRIHLPVYEVIRIHSSCAVVLVSVAVLVPVVCADRIEAVDHIRLLDDKTKAMEQHIAPQLTLSLEVVHTDLLVNVEEVKVGHTLYCVTAMAEILWTANHSAKILEQVVDMCLYYGRGR